jgi:hypothetical protein
VGTEAPPQIPDLAIVDSVVLLAEVCESERYARWPSGGSFCLGDDLGRLCQPMPARDALLDYLRRQTNGTLAALYALYRTSDFSCSATAEAMERYQNLFELIDQPIHHAHAAADLVAKGPLAHGLRCGWEQLGLRLESDPAGGSIDDTLNTFASPP